MWKSFMACRPPVLDDALQPFLLRSSEGMPPDATDTVVDLYEVDLRRIRVTDLSHRKGIRIKMSRNALASGCLGETRN